VKLPSKRREQAAQLLAEDRFPDRKIAELCGISEQSLNKWKQRPEFSARVEELIAAYAERALKFGLARRERRLTVLSDMHDRILSVIEERAADPVLAQVPGGKSGLVVRRLRGLSMLREEFEIDTGSVRELRGLEEQIARELGQWKEKTEVSGDLDGLAEHIELARKRMADDEYQLERARKLIAEHERRQQERQNGETQSDKS